MHLDWAQIIRELNKGISCDDKMELLMATQVKKPDSTTEAYLTHVSKDGRATDEFNHRGHKSIGTGEQHSYVFLTPFYKSVKSKMEGFARLAYFIIKYLDKFQIDAGIGLDNVEPHDKPQMWFIPDIGELYEGHERPQLVDQFESDTNKMLDNWKDYGISKSL